MGVQIDSVGNPCLSLEDQAVCLQNYPLSSAMVDRQMKIIEPLASERTKHGQMRPLSTHVTRHKAHLFAIRPVPSSFLLGYRGRLRARAVNQRATLVMLLALYTQSTHKQSTQSYHAEYRLTDWSMAIVSIKAVLSACYISNRRLELLLTTVSLWSETIGIGLLQTRDLTHSGLKILVPVIIFINSLFLD